MGTIAVCPPEYLPRLAYVALMQRVDCFVIADTYSYSRQSFQNRARLRTPQGWQWITIPLLGGQFGRPIEAVEIDGRPNWRRTHERAFVYNYRSAPFFFHVEEALFALIAEAPTRLGAFTAASVELLHGLFRCESRLVRASALPGRPARLPAVLEAAGGGTLVALPESAAHDCREVPSLERFLFKPPRYAQNFPGFVEEVTALDLLLATGPEAPALLRSGWASAAGL